MYNINIYIYICIYIFILYIYTYIFIFLPVKAVLVETVSFYLQFFYLLAETISSSKICFHQPDEGFVEKCIPLFGKIASTLKKS